MNGIKRCNKSVAINIGADISYLKYTMANRIIIIENNTEREVSAAEVKGIKINFNRGYDNSVYIALPYNCNNVMCIINGNGNKIVLGKNCKLSNTIINMGIEVDGRVAEVGADSVIYDSQFSISGAFDRVIIGKRCLIKSKSIFETEDGHTIFDVNTKEAVNYGGDIVIGDHVFIGNNAFIGKKVRIENDSVILPCSNVVKSIEKSNVLIGGNPARILREDINFSI